MVSGKVVARRPVLRDWPIRSHETIATGDAGTLNSTIPWMGRLVREGRASPVVQAKAQELASAAPHLHPCDAYFRYVQSMPYVRDELLAAEAGYGPELSEVLQGAPHQVELANRRGPGAVRGDCDCRAILFQSLCEAAGFTTRFATVRARGSKVLSHVYSEVDLGGGRWSAADTIMDGRGGRPRFRFGDEAQPPQATGKTTHGLGEGALLPLALLLLGACMLRSSR